MEKETVSSLIHNWFTGLWTEYYQWDQQYGNMMVPLYSLDIMYNLIKRIFQECERENMPSVLIDEEDKKEVFLSEYFRMMNRFLIHLEKVDDAYCLIQAKKGFTQIYKECPYYKMIESLKGDAEAQKKISGYIVGVITSLVADEYEIDSSD